MSAIECAKPLDLSDIAWRIKQWFDEKKFENKVLEDNGSYIVKARKSSIWRAVMGADRAINIIIEHSENSGTLVNVKQGDWTTNIVSNAVWFVFTGGANLAFSGWSFVLQKQLEKYIQDILDEAYLCSPENRKLLAES
ncbi:MAG: hypothetical protein GY749_15670 [Desulfobacteraceae bacterium]|nr:hypothetical protein [Desulfobacteraceae bacterium]